MNRQSLRIRALTRLFFNPLSALTILAGHSRYTNAA